MNHAHLALMAMAATTEVFQSQGIDLYHSKCSEQLHEAFGVVARWKLHPETFLYYKTNRDKLKPLSDGGYVAVLVEHYYSADAQVLLSKGILLRDPFWLLVLNSGSLPRRSYAQLDL